MPFYKVAFKPPKGYEDIDALYATTLQETATDAYDAARECLEAEIDEKLILQSVKVIDEDDWRAFMECPVHNDVRS